MALLTKVDITALEALSPGGVFCDVDLSSISHWRIGGKADVLLQPASTEQIVNLRRYFFERGIRPVIIGLTSNLLFADEGLRVPCIQIGSRLSRLEINATDVRAQAGNWVPGFAQALMRAGLTGGEHVCGIPGTLGGLVAMNGGSQRKGIGRNVVEVVSVDETGGIVRRTASECAFEYRDSIFHRNDDVIASVHMRFEYGDLTRIRAEMRTILAERRRKFPRKEPNCGSVFKSNPDMYAQIGPPGAAIERLGLKGLRYGGALVSPRHANFIVNTGNARASDVLHLITLISDAVFSSTGFRMEAEARFVRGDGKIVPADRVIGASG